MIEIIMRPSIIGKLLGAVVCAGLSVYNLASSNDQVLIRSANSSSSRTEVRVFESPSKQLNLMSGVAFGLMFCTGVYLALNEYNSVVEEVENIECIPDLEDHPQQSSLVMQQQPVMGSEVSVQQQQQQQVIQQPVYAVQPPPLSNIGKSHLRLVNPSTVPPTVNDTTAASNYLVSPSEFMRDMEDEDYWNDKDSLSS